MTTEKMPPTGFVENKNGRLFASTICKACGKKHVLLDEPMEEK